MKLATLCYVQRDDQTLMVHRIKKANDMHQGKWNGVGGKLEPGETPEECAIREIYEETGLQVTEVHLRGFLTFPAFNNDEDWYAFVFTACQFSGELIELPEGTLEWVDNSRLLALNLWEGDRIFLPWVLTGRFFSGKFVYENGSLINHSIVFHPTC